MIMAYSEDIIDKSVHIKYPKNIHNDIILDTMQSLNITGILMRDWMSWSTKERYLTIYIPHEHERVIFKLKFSGSIV